MSNCWIKNCSYTRCIADENDSDLRYSEVPPKGKNKILVKILGGRQHRTTPAGQILGGRDPCNPCGVDAYAFYAFLVKKIASGCNNLRKIASGCNNLRNIFFKVPVGDAFPSPPFLDPPLVMRRCSSYERPPPITGNCCIQLYRGPIYKISYDYLMIILWYCHS